MRARQFLESLKALEQKPEEAAEQFRSLFEEAPVAYHQTDRKGIVRRVNRAECAQARTLRRKFWASPSGDWSLPSSRKPSVKLCAGRSPGNGA